MASRAGEEGSYRNFVWGVLAIGFMVGCIWRFTSLHQRYGLETLIQWGKFLQGSPWTPVVVIFVFMMGGLFFFLHAVLLWCAVFTFDPLHALIYCEAGSFASAMLVYGLGRVLRKDVIRRLAGSYMEQVSRALAHKGVLTLVLLHIFPICPFSFLNLLAGATHINLRDYVVGTLLGITPGILVLCFFGRRILSVLHHPTWPEVLGMILFVGIGFWALSRLRESVRARIGV